MSDLQWLGITRMRQLVEAMTHIHKEALQWRDIPMKDELREAYQKGLEELTEEHQRWTKALLEEQNR